MRREAFLRALKAYAKSENLAFSWDPIRGKGGHGTVTVGSAFTDRPERRNQDWFKVGDSEATWPA